MRPIRSHITIALVLAVSLGFLNEVANAQTDYKQEYIDLLEETCQVGLIGSCLKGVELREDEAIDRELIGAFLKKACELGNTNSCPSSEPEAPRLNRENFQIDVKDREAMPLVRMSPVIPMRFIGVSNNSGYCDVQFNVLRNGSTSDIEIMKCTDRSLKRETIRIVTKWKYRPKIVGGKSVVSREEARVAYHISDERGQVLPFPDE